MGCTTIAAVVLLATTLVLGRANAAEITGWFAGGIAGVTRELIPQFEKTSGHKVTATYSLVAPIRERVSRGEIADAVIVPWADFDAIWNAGKIIPGTRGDIAKTGIGVAIRAGAPMLDVSSLEAFKHTLLSVKSIGYVDPQGGAGSSKQIDEMFERIGLRQQLMQKAKIVSGGRSLFELITKQEADLGVYIISEIVTAPGIELAGPLPREIQFYASYSGGVLAQAREPGPATELMKFLTSPSALPVIKAKGMEPF
jgi:molybdate transport system substrate-binding protein